MKHYYKLLLLTALLSIQGYSFRVVASVPSPVDSIYYIIQGDWYMVHQCMGFTGWCDSVYSTSINRIERVGNSDTISWKIYKNSVLIDSTRYLINKKYAWTVASNRWMLSTIYTPPAAGGMHTGLLIDYLFNADASNLALYMDVCDGSSTKYIRTMRPNSVYHERVDSIADCLRGDWYDVYKCLGFSGICDSVNSGPKVTLNHQPGSDSITWGGMKYRLYESDDNITGQLSWMISTTLNNYSPDSIHSLPVVFPISYLISCNNGTLSLAENFVDGQTTVYTYNARTNTAGIENAVQDKAQFSISPNPVRNCLQITGSAPIGNIQVADIWGNIVCKKHDTRNIDVSNLPKGMYLVRISNKVGYQTIKIIKE